MEIDYYEMILTGFTGLISAVLGIVWKKVDEAEKTAQANRTTLAHLEKQLDKTTELTERLSSLEASFSAEIKNLSISIKRMESALLRIDQNRRS